jgi:hypothetical protein
LPVARDQRGPIIGGPGFGQREGVGAFVACRLEDHRKLAIQIGHVVEIARVIASRNGDAALFGQLIGERLVVGKTHGVPGRGGQTERGGKPGMVARDQTDFVVAGGDQNPAVKSVLLGESQELIGGGRLKRAAPGQRPRDIAGQAREGRTGGEEPDRHAAPAEAARRRQTADRAAHDQNAGPCRWFQRDGVGVNFGPCIHGWLIPALVLRENF